MKIKINLGEILTKAWQITWKFKVLWIFGILASCAGNSRGSFNFNTGNSWWNSGNGNTNPGRTFPGSGQFSEWLRQFQGQRPEQALRAFWAQYMGIIITVILALCVLWILFYFLGVIGKTGLIKGAATADSGAESLPFGELWSESRPYFWRMFGLSILVGLPLFLLLVIALAVMGFGVFSAIQGGGTDNGILAMMSGTILIFLCLMCVISILSLIINLIIKQSENAIVLEDVGVLPSLGRGWEVFSQNWLSVVVVGLIQWVIGIVVGIIIALPLLMVLVPVAIGMGAAVATQNWTLIAVMFCGCLAIWVPVSKLLAGIELTYFQSMWTLTYRRLTTPVAPVVVAPASIENAEPQ
jgi:hypothetical protein